MNAEVECVGAKLSAAIEEQFMDASVSTIEMLELVCSGVGSAMWLICSLKSAARKLIFHARVEGSNRQYRK